MRTAARHTSGVDSERRVQLRDLVVSGCAPKQREGAAARGQCRSTEVRRWPPIFAFGNVPRAEDCITSEAQHVAVVLRHHVDEPVASGVRAKQCKRGATCLSGKP